MTIDQVSFSQSGFPSKLLHSNFKSSDGKILPVHVAISPTNKCNLNCSFCLQKNRNKKESIPWILLKQYIDIFKKMGTRAFTITGGGEPLMYQHIIDFLQYSKSQDIGAGIISNGILLNKLSKAHLDLLTWCRISFSCEWPICFLDSVQKSIERFDLDKTTVGGIYVISKEEFQEGKFENLIKVAKVCIGCGFRYFHITHDTENIDIINLESLYDSPVGEILSNKIVSLYSRKNYSNGIKKCLVSLLKPALAADGLIYPCCGISVATDKYYCKNPMFSMCSINNLIETWEKQKFFDGSKCKLCRCYMHNVVLNMMDNIPEHLDWL